MSDEADGWVMSAREDGFCVVCHELYEEGEDVIYDAQLDGWMHKECA